MSLFQKTVIDNFLSKIKDEDFESNWNAFQDYYLKEDTQQRIKSKKEEEFQHDFLEFIFDNCLDYNIKDSADQNLFKEVKNVTDSKKADGAIKKGEDIIAVIELKSTKTKDFNEIEKQAFGYKNNHPNCSYVISSNFQKLRFYIDDATKYEEFDLFNLDKETFKLLWVCLSKNNLFEDVAKKLKSESILEEENITKKLYKDYSEFRKEIFNNLVELNPKIDKLTLFKKTQKLLDRFLFIFFAEDKGLVPTNSISKIIDQWEDSFTGSDSLYTVFKQYFMLLNEGRPKRGDKEAIYAYNGGLFEDDELLNTIKIDDDLLFKHTKNLSHYDFRSEISVDILGHIFEHSLSEIEEIQKEISGEEVEQSKRKKDGIFYTPAYITKYMVENTVGKLCDEKKKELEINEENYSDPKRRTKVRIENLDNYREWLLDLKICDPACGSGAFLNQALNFLIDEHSYIDNLKNTYLGGSIPFSDIENSILENNLYGVDINEESVEIAKLSLWLRTAQKERKLTSLSNNIKCGDSLCEVDINSSKRGFVWKNEFPDIFSKGGFDVVVGNPPYVDIKQIDPELTKFYFDNFKTAENRINLYSLFIEKGFQILNKDGILTYINPNSLLLNSSYKKIRNLIFNSLSKIIKLPDDTFKNIKVETIIIELRKENSNKKIDIIKYNKDEIINYIDNSRTILFDKKDWDGNDKKFNIYVTKVISSILDKIEVPINRLIDIADFSLGITPYDKYKGHSEETIKEKKFHSKTKLNNNYKPLISGENIQRFYTKKDIKGYINYGDWLGAKRDERFFKKQRILIRQIISGNPPRIYAGYSDLDQYFTQIGFGVIPKDHNKYSSKLLLTILNSNLINFYHKYTFLDLEKNLFQKILIANCKKFPIVDIKDDDKIELEELAEKIIDKYRLIENLNNKFIELLKSDFNFNETSKLSNWYNLEWSGLERILKKININISGEKKEDWFERFNRLKKEVIELNYDCIDVENEINTKIYTLYSLTKEEIEIVENS